MSRGGGVEEEVGANSIEDSVGEGKNKAGEKKEGGIRGGGRGERGEKGGEGGDTPQRK